MLIKVCGMRDAENMAQVSALDINWMGFIFYPKSPRFVDQPEALAAAMATSLNNADRRIKRVGVFVNASLTEMLETAMSCQLDLLQLHGNESADDCYALQKRGYSVIKAFSIATAEDLLQTASYAGRADYFLFDTKCAGYGGSGQTFDWNLLQQYTGDTPFLLSGGIAPESIASLRAFSHPKWAGIDLNSAFETAPAQKDATRLAAFISAFKTN